MSRQSPSAQKRKRSSSRSSDLEVDGAPPSTRRRSHSPSEDSGSDSDGPAPPKDAKLKLGVADMELENTSRTKANDSAADMDLKKKEKDSAQRAEFAKLLNTRSGGVYIPPARLRAMQAAASTDKTSAEYQRLSWDALRKSITGIVNRVNITNIKLIVPELFSENLIRGRGLFARSVMKAQASSLPFTPIFAALVAIINTKLPQVGELVLTRLISQFRRSFKRNDKIVCHSTTTFIAHLVNQAVAHEIVALQILVLLLERPTDDSIEIAVGFTREVGAFLTEVSPKANATVFERFRAVLNEGRISQRVQYMIEVLMQVRKDKYKDNPILPEGLDLVEEDEQITHQIQLEEELQIQEGLNIFKFDPNYLENEEKYKSIKAEILGEDSGESESGSEEDSDEDDEVAETKEGIEDRTETNLVNLRRIIYLTIMNALNYEEAVHKLLKVQLQEGEEIELVNMVIECCSQERSYSTFYGLVGERFSKLNRVWTDCFEEAFVNYYTTIHRYETNRLRNIARFFGHLVSTDAISWMVLECVKINEEDTTSSSRIFIKIMMQEMMESMGLKGLAERFKDPEVKQGSAGMFPTDIPKNTRFAINYFTSIGLGVLTEEMREYLKNAPKLIMEQRRALEADSSSSSDSDSDSSGSDTSSESDSDSEMSDETSSAYSRRRGASNKRRESPSLTPPPRRRGRSLSRTPPRLISDSAKERPKQRYRERSPVTPPRGLARDKREIDMDTRPDYPRRGEHSPPPPRLPPQRRGRSLSPTPPRRISDSARERARQRYRERSPVTPPRGSARDKREIDTEEWNDRNRRPPLPPPRSPSPLPRLAPGRRMRSVTPPRDVRRSRTPPAHVARFRDDGRRDDGDSRRREDFRGGRDERDAASRRRSPPSTPPPPPRDRVRKEDDRRRDDLRGGRNERDADRRRSPPPTPPRRSSRGRERDHGYERRR